MTRLLHRRQMLAGLGASLGAGLAGALLPRGTAHAAERPGAGLVAVTLQDRGVIALVDPVAATVVGEIAVDRKPVGAVPSPDGARLYVSHPELGSITVIDVAVRAIAGRIVTGGTPFGLEIAPDGRTLFATDWTRNAVLRFDIAAHLGAAADASVGTGRGLALVGKAPAWLKLDPATGLLFVAAREADRVDVVDAHGFSKIAEIPTGRAPFAVTLDRAARRVLVGNVQSADVTTIDADRLVATGSFAVGAMPYSLAVAPADGLVLVVSQTPGVLQFFDRGKPGLAARRTARLGRYPEGMAIVADRAIVANWFDDTVSIIALDDGRETARLKVSGGPRIVTAM